MTDFIRFGRNSALTIALFALAVLAVPSFGLAQEAPIKIGVVNIDYIVAQSSAGKALKAQLDEFQKTAQAEIDAKGQAAAAIREQANQGVNSLAESRLQELAKEFEDAQIALKRLQDDKQREGQKLQAEGLRKIEQQLEPIFEAVRDEDGYDLILANVPGVIVMAGERVEITQKVLDRMNTSAGN